MPPSLESRDGRAVVLFVVGYLSLLCFLSCLLWLMGVPLHQAAIFASVSTLVVWVCILFVYTVRRVRSQ